MNIVDIGIIIVLILGGIIGFKRGFTKSVIKAVGFILTVVLAFLLKNGLASVFYDKLPFFNFDGLFKGITVLNIALYELIAFLILLALFSILLKFLIFISSIFEKLLAATVILSIPSKIAGAIVGIVQNYVLVFIILYVVSLPVFNLDFVDDSKYKEPILKNTPILNSFSKTTTDVMNEFISLKDKYETSTSPDEFNLDTLDLFLKYKVITIESADKLVTQGKIKAQNQERLIGILNQYRETNDK